jgi:hypothetical protein
MQPPGSALDQPNVVHHSLSAHKRTESPQRQTKSLLRSVTSNPSQHQLMQVQMQEMGDSFEALPRTAINSELNSATPSQQQQQTPNPTENAHLPFMKQQTL